MSILIPFDQCIARPDDKDGKHLLTEHLLQVKKYMENELPFEDDILKLLMGLAGVCHDVAKCNVMWQDYIKNTKKKNRPSHSAAGAFLFSYLAFEFLQQNDAWEDYQKYWGLLLRDIADHHGKLKDLQDLNWKRQPEWSFMDLQGMEEFIHSNFPELHSVEINEKKITEWFDIVNDYIKDLEYVFHYHFHKPDSLEAMLELQKRRYLTTVLIAGDRFHVQPTEGTWFDSDDMKQINENIDNYCNTEKDNPMYQIRSKAQLEVLKKLELDPDKLFYTLEMPTGYGKTITALKMANWFCQQQGYRKIVYVAPYISILEQTSKVIEEAMKVIAMEHHSLAVPIQENTNNQEVEQRVSSTQLAMESWAHSIVCTSFQQWSKAMFPDRAQDVLRRTYLKDSIIIIDEPQIFNLAGWNLFLTGLEALAKENRLKVIFLSATMPPFKYGLSLEPRRLIIKGSSQIERYQIQVYKSAMDEKQLASFLTKRQDKTQAVILNTIKDAYLVYDRLDKENNDVRLLHGMMIPLHKKIEIFKMQRDIKNWKTLEKKIIVVSTQVIEAGVDVSFQHVVRALAILTSIVQAAGRVNRHRWWGNQGTLSVIPFLREGIKDTRTSVYKEKSIRNITDQLLYEKEIWNESETIDLIKIYYEKLFHQNTYDAEKKAIYEAYKGNWTELSKFKPFGDDDFRLPLYIPWVYSDADTSILPPEFKKLQSLVGISDPIEIYKLYLDRRFMQNMSFDQRKLFMILMNHYIINIPIELAKQLVGLDVYLQNRIPFLDDSQAYNQITGLAERYVKGFDNII